jgi:MoaA/NifB/PqqE/SkfB family radical SAM enzyme
MYKYDIKDHHFIINENVKVSDLKKPMSISLQVTRNCNLKCVYCSEIGYYKDPSLNEIENMLTNLKEIERIIITGGEPLVRNDIINILQSVKENNIKTVALATNAINLTNDLLLKMSPYLDYIDVTIDGPRKVHNKIRGRYDDVIKGVNLIKDSEIPFNLVTVMYEDNVDVINYTCQISDMLGAKKLKIMTPISKGRGKNIIDKKVKDKNIEKVFDQIKNQKERCGWTPRITLIDWNMVGEGHALLIHPNGDVVASPVPSEEECIKYIGNLLKEDIIRIWEKYPYKQNHMNKYIERSLYVC